VGEKGLGTPIRPEVARMIERMKLFIAQRLTAAAAAD
jgi:hypothetical protein